MEIQIRDYVIRGNARYWEVCRRVKATPGNPGGLKPTDYYMDLGSAAKHVVLRPVRTSTGSSFEGYARVLGQLKKELADALRPLREMEEIGTRRNEDEHK